MKKKKKKVRVFVLGDSPKRGRQPQLLDREVALGIPYD